MNAISEQDTLKLLQTDDASKWAKAFCAMEKKIAGVELDEGWVLGWFANAIETAKMIEDRRIIGSPVEHPFFNMAQKKAVDRYPHERALIAALITLSMRGDFHLADEDGVELPCSALTMEGIFDRLVLKHDALVLK